MENEFVTSLVIAIATQIPVLLIWVIGISLSLYFHHRNPKKFYLSLVAFLIFLLNTIANSVFSAWVTTSFVATGKPFPQMTLIAAGFLSTIGSTIGWVILFFAIFSPKFNSIEGNTSQLHLPGICNE